MSTIADTNAAQASSKHVMTAEDWAMMSVTLMERCTSQVGPTVTLGELREHYRSETPFLLDDLRKFDESVDPDIDPDEFKRLFGKWKVKHLSAFLAAITLPEESDRRPPKGPTGAPATEAETDDWLREVCERNTVVIGDVDEFSDESAVADAQRQIRALPYVGLCDLTPSGLGLRVLIHCLPWETKQQYKNRWEIAFGADKTVGQIAIDVPSVAEHIDPTSDPNRVSFPLIVHDDDEFEFRDTIPVEACLATPTADIITLPTIRSAVVPPEHRSESSQRRSSDGAPKLPPEIEHRRLLDALSAVPADCDNHTFEQAVVRARDAGLSEQEINDWAQTGGAAYDSDAPKRIKSFIESNPHSPGAAPLIKFAVGFGFDSTLRRWQGHRGREGGRPPGRATSVVGAVTDDESRTVLDISATATSEEIFQTVLAALGVELRYNTLAASEEVRLAAQLWPDETNHDWRTLDADLSSLIRIKANDTLALRVAGARKSRVPRWTKTEWIEQKAAYRAHKKHQHDPFRDYLESLPEVSEDCEPESWLGLGADGMFKIAEYVPPDEHDITRKLAEWTARAAIVAIVARTYEPRSSISVTCSQERKESARQHTSSRYSQQSCDSIIETSQTL